MKLRALLSLATGLALSGCLTTDGANFFAEPGVEASPFYTWNCPEAQAEAAKAADWKTASVAQETIKDEVYQEGLLSLQVGKPYIVRVTNEDDLPRTFRAPDLFQKSSVLKVVHEGADVTAACLQAVVVAPKQTTEIHMVPLEAGYYDYHETFLQMPMLTEITTNGSVGLAFVY